MTTRRGAPESNELLAAALDYARRGWPVFPLHGIREQSCTCGRPKCDSPGKHPRTEHGLKDATTDPAAIRARWDQWPDSNIGGVTGAASKTIVLDFDPRHGGERTLAEVAAAHGELPPTPLAATGGGGWHAFFAHPGRQVRNRAGILPGLDVRGDGGYVVLPPSLHASGRRYAWRAGLDVLAAPIPAWLAGLLMPLEHALPPAAVVARAEGAKGSDYAEAALRKECERVAGAVEGQRNATLNCSAFSLGQLVAGAEIERSTVERELLIAAETCGLPQPEAERTIRSGLAAGEKEPHTARTSRRLRKNPWVAIRSVSDFLDAPEPDGDFLEPRLLARGSLTLFFSPRGLGKTHAAHALAVEQARRGRRVLLIDRDNSRRELKRRLRGWGAHGLPNLSLLGRDDAPPLTDRQAWAVFPFADYDLVVIDSLDSSTEGVGEQDSGKPGLALASLLDIAHTAAGPAVLVLGNTVKSGSHGRGSGVIEDRADIVYEVRDATDLRPSGTKDWWLELPPADRGSWADRAARRKKRDKYRLAFVPSKFRVGEEPDPFVFEIRLDAGAWTFEDVTNDIVAAGAVACDEAAQQRVDLLERAAVQLAPIVAARAASGTPMHARDDAVPFLTGLGLARAAARRLIVDRAGKDWQLAGGARRGDPAILLPPSEHDSEREAAGMQPQARPRQMRLEESRTPAALEPGGRPESASAQSSPDAAKINGPSWPTAVLEGWGSGAECLTDAPCHDLICPDCGERVLRWGFGDVCTSCRRRFPPGWGPEASSGDGPAHA